MLEALTKLGFDPAILVSQLVNIIVLFVILYAVAYKPLMKMLDERSGRIKESMEQAQALQDKTAGAEKEIKKQLEAASREGQERIARAAKSGEDLRLKAKEDAKREADTLIMRARADIGRERDEAISELRKEFADLTILAAEKVIDRSMDKKAHRELIDKVLEESSALKVK